MKNPLGAEDLYRRCIASCLAGSLGLLLVSTAACLDARVAIQIFITQQPPAITVSWIGGHGPFQLQETICLSNATWQNVGPPTTNRSLVLFPEKAAAFFRVSEPEEVVGRLADGNFVLPTSQIVPDNGEFVLFSGKPVDLVLSPDGRTAYVKSTWRLLVVDTASWTVRQGVGFPESGPSMHGITVSKDGSHGYVTGAGNELYEWTTNTDGSVLFSRTISLPPSSYPCGIALSADGATAYVCLSLLNTVAKVNLTDGTIIGQIQVGIAPYEVLISSDGATAYVSDWGGRFPGPGDITAFDCSIRVVADERGIGSCGVVSIVDLAGNVEEAQVPTGLHPSEMQLSRDGSTLYVANANSDTVTVIDTRSRSVRETIDMRPMPSLPYGSTPNSLALSSNGSLLYVANGCNNAIAVVELPNGQHINSVVKGFIPTDWYPGAVVTDETNLYIADVNGPGIAAFVGNYLGRCERIPHPSLATLSNLTAQTFANMRLPEILQAQAPAQEGRTSVPVPENVGEPSIFRHVFYIVKENKTYDVIFGDMAGGNGDTNLCVYPRLVSPNHHALADEFVLLDNFYCNGIWSAEGCSWATEGNCSDYLQKAIAGYSRGTAFEGGALVCSQTGFIWNYVLEHGLSVRNYGGMGWSFPHPGNPTWLQVYQDYTNHAGQIQFNSYITIPVLAAHSSTNVLGYNFGIPDQIRADGFLKDFNEAQSNGFWATFHLMALSDDHTVGATPGFPTPCAMVADNDLALGRIVEAITRSIFWTNTVIFVIEDDPMDGYDHVDGHRSICLVISPYTKRGQTISKFYNQTGVLHTMEQIMGIPPMNQMDAMSPLMTDCFTSVPDFTPYTALPNNIPLDTMNPGTTTELTSEESYWANESLKLDFSGLDRANEDVLNRIIWHSAKGDARYPSEFVGAHGKGLEKLGLVPVTTNRTDDDD